MARALCCFAIAFAISIAVVQCKNKVCENCDPEDCPKLYPQQCLAGITKDECECCDVCSQVEGERCDLGEKRSRFGDCGDNLRCQAYPDKKRNKKEGLCFCIYDEELCGSDGKTYNNFCHLKATMIREDKPDLTLEYKGRCHEKHIHPVIISAPMHAKNKSGENVALGCEVKGYPIPTIQWILIKSNNASMELPGDDMRVSINSRGGPETNEITGWVQIMDIQKEHEGDYMCVAINEMGMAKARARVIVIADSGDKRANHRQGDL